MLLQDFKSICLENKYTKWYFNIINNALVRGWNKKTAPVYVEGHHIVPKSIVKNNNLVYLTAREHFICHLLLVKMLDGKNKRKMVLALHRLVFGNKHNNIIYVKNAKEYANIKLKASKYLSERSQEYWDNIPKEQRTLMRSGEKNSMFGKSQKEDSKLLISEKAKARLKDKTRHPLYGIGHSEQTKINMSLNAPAKQYAFMYNNKKVDVYNLRKFCRENGLDQGAMTRLNSEKQKIHKGYSKWHQ